MGKRLVRLMNRLTRLRRIRCRPEQILLLVPTCLQRSECPQKVSNDINACLRCGRCKIKDIIELAEKYGISCAIATGGRQAVEMALQDDVKAVVAIACEKELQQGVLGIFPKPGVGVINIRPNGPCKDTDVDLEEVEDAIKWFLRE